MKAFWGRQDRYFRLSLLEYQQCHQQSQDIVPCRYHHKQCCAAGTAAPRPLKSATTKAQHQKKQEQQATPWDGRLSREALLPLSWHRLVAQSPTTPPSSQHWREGWGPSAPAIQVPDLEREQNGPQTAWQKSKTKQKAQTILCCSPCPPQTPQLGSGCLLCPGCVHNPWVKLLNH